MSEQLNQLCNEWRLAKRTLDEARTSMIETEEKIIALVGNKEEGSQTQKTDQFKITTTGVINRRLDPALLDAVIDQIPLHLRPIKTKVELDKKGYAYIKENEPAIYKLLSPAVTIKPGKTSVKIEVL